MKVVCILNMGCAHGAANACQVLSRCGADRVLQGSRQPDGYVCHRGNSPAINALLREGKVSSQLGETGNYQIIRSQE